MSDGDGDAELTALADGSLDLIVLHDGSTMRTHGPKSCVGPSCCIHNPSEHPLRNAPLSWSREMRVMFRVCEHDKIHPDPDGMEYRTLLAYVGAASWYDGWHPCCESRCCEGPRKDYL